MEVPDLIRAAKRDRTNVAGAPAGGRAVPSRSAGKYAFSLEPDAPVLTNVAGWPASIFDAVERERLRAEESRSGGIEHIVAHVIAVRPHAEMRIIEEVRSKVKGVTIVATGGVAGGRDRDTFVGRYARAGKLADEPAVGELIVQHDRVTVAVALTNAAEATPDRRDSDGPVNRCSGRFVKDLKAFIDHLRHTASAPTSPSVSGGAQLQPTPGKTMPSKLSTGLRIAAQAARKASVLVLNGFVGPFRTRTLR